MKSKLSNFMFGLLMATKKLTIIVFLCSSTTSEKKTSTNAQSNKMNAKEDECVYDTDCLSPGERVCLDKFCRCINDELVWDGVQKCQTPQFLESLESPTAKVTNIGPTLAIFLGVGALLLVVAIAVIVTYYMNQILPPDQESGEANKEDRRVSETFKRTNTLTEVTNITRSSSPSKGYRDSYIGLIRQSVDQGYSMAASLKHLEQSKAVKQSYNNALSGTVPLDVQMGRPVHSVMKYPKRKL